MFTIHYHIVNHSYSYSKRSHAVSNSMSLVPIGTYLAKLQHSLNRGMLTGIIHEDATQPFHFGVVKMEFVPERDEFMIFQVATYPKTSELCGKCYAYFTQFKAIMGEEPKTMESSGVRIAMKVCKAWNALLVLFTPYRYPESFLYNSIMRLNLGISQLFKRPSYLAAQFVSKSLIMFMKAMATVQGFGAVIASYKAATEQKAPFLPEDDSILADVGANKLVRAVLEDSEISGKCAIFVFGRILYATMTNTEITLAELLVANLSETTAERETIGGRLYCMARHFHTVMVTITDPGHGLEKCCAMQVALMKLDVQGLIAKMQQSFGKKLPPLQALDVLILSGPFMVTNPPFIEAPLFAETELPLRANAVAAEMYEKMMSPGFKCIVNYIIEKTDLRVKFSRHGDTMSFVHSTQPLDESELAPLPHMLKALRVMPSEAE